MRRGGWLRRLAGVARRWVAAAPANMALGLLSLGLAVFVWLAVTTSQSPPDSRTFDVRANPVSVPRDYAVSGVSPDKVTVILRGPRNLLSKVSLDEVVAQVDLSGESQEGTGQPEYTVTRRVAIDFPARGGRLRVEPLVDEVKVTLERLERKEMPVVVNTVGVAPVGIVAKPSVPEPATVTVLGPARNLKLVDRVSADVKLDGVTVSVSPSVPLEARDPAGRTVGGVSVQPNTATVKVEIKQELFSKQVLINVLWRGTPRTGFRAMQWRSDPSLVTVFGPLDQINPLSAVPTDAIDIEGADRDVVRSVRIQLPQGVTASQQSVIATIPIQVVSASAPVGVVPRVVNVGPGLTAQLVTPIVALTFRGPLGDLAQLRPTDVSVTVDATGLNAGTHRLEPKVTFPATLQLDVVVPDRVEVVLK